MVLVDVGGVYSYPVVPCQCGTAEDIWKQLFHLGLFPASFAKPRTAFTFAVLDYFQVDALECTTAAMGFYSKLRRLTNEVFPHTVPVRIMAQQALRNKTSIISLRIATGSSLESRDSGGI